MVVRWVIIVVVALLTCMLVSNVNEDDDDKVVLVIGCRHRRCHISRSFTVLGLWGVLAVLVGVFRRRWSSFWGSCVGCVLLLLFLGDHGR